MYPWQHEQFESFNNTYDKFYGNQVYNTRYETIPDSKRLIKRKGDIIKFGSGYFENDLNNWADWFVDKTDKKRFWKRNKKIPKYAMNQYGIVANRYRWIKFKHITYSDYGAVVMFLTGNRPLKCKKYYVTNPYKLISRFPHLHRDGSIYVNMKKPFRVIDKTWFLFDFNLSDFIKQLLDKDSDSEKTRNHFLKKIYQLLEVHNEHK